MKKEMHGLNIFAINIFLFFLLVVYVKAQEADKTNTVDSKIKESFDYRQVGNRDPFKPFIKILGEKEQKPKTSKSVPPIKRYPLVQFKLVGIIWVGERPKAMVIDPEKNTYFLGIGEEIGNKHGKIVEIKDDVIIVVEQRYFEDVMGQRKFDTVKSVLSFKE
jgi:Tfp pilus assembly protein PilP